IPRPAFIMVGITPTHWACARICWGTPLSGAEVISSRMVPALSSRSRSFSRSPSAKLHVVRRIKREVREISCLFKVRSWFNIHRVHLHCLIQPSSTKGNGLTGEATASVNPCARAHFPTAVPNIPARSRRYTRIAISLPVVVRDQFGGREETRTQFVTVRGAIIATNSILRVGHKLTLQIAKTGNAAECHVVGIEPVVKDGNSVEVEFTREQQDFWPVQFPQEDLKTDSGSYRFKTQASPSFGTQSSGLGDSSKHQLSQPPIRGANEIVSLADSIAGEAFSSAPASTSTSTSFNAPEKFTSRSAPIDSVAQFRAANRAAHS